MIFTSINDQNKSNKLKSTTNNMVEKNNENEEKNNIFNQKIFESILKDDAEQFLQLIQEQNSNTSNPNQKFHMSHYHLPEVLEANPTYFSLCAYSGAEKCFTALINLFPSGIKSDELKQSDDFGRSPIHFACIGGNLQIIQELHNNGFELSSRDSESYLPSHYAAMAGKLEAINYLWLNGGDIFRSSSGKTGITPVQVACYYGNLNIVRFFFEIVPFKETNYGRNSDHVIRNLIMGELITYDPNKRDLVLLHRQQTPLHFACDGRNVNIVNYFVSRPDLISEQINKTGKSSRTPLNSACHSGSLDCVKALMNCKQLKLRFDKKSTTYLPLVDASAGGYLDIVQYLLKDNRIDVTQETSTNLSPFHVAVKNDHFDVVKCLYNNGATKKLNDNKIGVIFLDAMATKNKEMIYYLDKALNVPYHEIYINVIKGSKKRNTLIKNEHFDKITFGDMFMHQVFLYEDQELTNFLLDKKCTFNLFNAQNVLKKVSKSFADFLVQKGLGSKQSNSDINDEIVSAIEAGNLSKIKSLISKGAVINNDIIFNNNLIQSSCLQGNLQLFQFLLKIRPVLTEKEIIESMKNSMYRYIDVGYCGSNKKDLIDVIEIMNLLLMRKNIDFNQSIFENGAESDSFISIAISKRDFTLINLFNMYGANINLTHF